MNRHSQYAVVAACLGLASCTAKAPDSGKIRIVAVESVYGDLAKQLGGDAVDVTTILDSPSADPHAYEPTPRDADAVGAADLVLENGLGYDAFADKLVAASPRSGRTVLVAGTLGGFVLGDNPHVWYQARTLARIIDAVAADLERRLPSGRATIERRKAALTAWVGRFAARIAAIARTYGGTSVAITEPVFDYVLGPAKLRIATPPSFSHAIEEGNDPAPQDVEAMRALLAGRRVAAFIYNNQTVEPSTKRLLEVAAAARVPVVPVSETLPAHLTTQAWIDGEVGALERAL